MLIPTVFLAAYGYYVDFAFFEQTDQEETLKKFKTIHESYCDLVRSLLHVCLLSLLKAYIVGIAALALGLNLYTFAKMKLHAY